MKACVMRKTSRHDNNENPTLIIFIRPLIHDENCNHVQWLLVFCRLPFLLLHCSLLSLRSLSAFPSSSSLFHSHTNKCRHKWTISKLSQHDKTWRKMFIYMKIINKSEMKWVERDDLRPMKTVNGTREPDKTHFTDCMLSLKWINVYCMGFFSPKNVSAIYFFSRKWAILFLKHFLQCDFII